MAKSKSSSNPLGTVRRSIWYVLRAVLVVSLLLGLAFAVFTEGMYISNMFIVVTEGMALRAETILKNGSVSDLSQYFAQEFLDSDDQLLSGEYLDYAVDSYDYRYSIKSISVLPWAKSGHVGYVERIPTIVGAPVSDDVTSGVPAWTPVRYRVNLVKIEGRWLISSLTVEEMNPEEEARPTPDYSQLETESPH